MTLANLPEGANPARSLQSKLEAMLDNSEPVRPTESQEREKAEEPVGNVETEVETLAESDTEPKRKTFKAKLGDREIEYAILSEIEDEEAENLRLGTMMEHDYRRKTMSVAEKEKALQSEAEKLNGKIGELEDILSFESSWLDSDEAKELREDDPDVYLQKIESIKRKADKYQKFKAEQQAKSQEQYKKQLEAEISKYSEIIPDWLDSSRRDGDLVNIEKTLRNTGFDDDFIKQAWGMDHRFMSLLRKAALFDQIKSKSVKTKEAVKKQKSATPGVKQDAAVKTKTQKVKENFRANRNDKKAQQQLFESFL